MMGMLSKLNTGIRRSLVVGLAGMALLGCKKDDPIAPPAPATSSGWVYQSTAPRADVAVVFVHGIFGDARGTWTNENGKTFFELIHKHPKIGKPFDIFAFGFPSAMLGSGSFDVQDASKALYDKLVYYQLANYSSVVFVAHSMGGLVVMRTLMTYPDFRKRTPLVVLYGTPQEGAQISTIAQKISKNPALDQMLPADKDGYLRGLDTDWKLQDPKTRPKVVCAFEKKPTYGYLVVPWSSATRFCDGPASPIGESHLGMVKPSGAEHDSVIVLVNALNEALTGPQFVADLSTPDFAPQGSDFVFSLASPVGTHPARLVNMGKKSATFTLADISSDLHIWPNDTPRELPGGEKIDLVFSLGWGATASEYHFLLRSDAGAEKKVFVKVSNMAAFLAQQEKLQQVAAANVNALLQAPKMRAAWGSAADQQQANQDIADNVRETVRSANPNLPKEAQWVLAAEVMNAMQLPELSLVALANSRREHPSAAATPAFTRLAMVTQNHVDAAKVGKLVPFTRPDTDAASQGKTTATAMQTAVLLKNYPGLTKLGTQMDQKMVALEVKRKSELLTPMIKLDKNMEERVIAPPKVEFRRLDLQKPSPHL
jgi:hypothetical protein